MEYFAGNRFKLAFYRETERRYVLAEVYLAQAKTAYLDWTPNTEYAGLSLTADGKEWVLERRSVGSYFGVISQLKALAHRLRANQIALLRTATDDAPEGTYFLFEAEGGTVYISLFTMHDPDMAVRYPVPEQFSGELYQYVEQNKAVLLSTETAYSYGFTRVPFPKTHLIEDLEREITVGQHIAALMGESAVRR